MSAATKFMLPKRDRLAIGATQALGCVTTGHGRARLSPARGSHNQGKRKTTDYADYTDTKDLKSAETYRSFQRV